MKQISDAMKQVCIQAQVYTPEVLEWAMEPTFEKAKKYTPVKTGALLASAFMEIRKEAKGPRLVIGFASSGDPYYAIYVHEMVEHFHPLPTRSKFLTSAVMEDLGSIQDRLVQGYAYMFGNQIQVLTGSWGRSFT